VSARLASAASVQRPCSVQRFGEGMQTAWLARIIGLVIGLASIGAAVLLWFAVGADMPVNPVPPIQEGFVLGWDFLYARVRPPARVFWAAVAIAILAASSVALVERVAAGRLRRSLNPRETPLAPVVRMAEPAWDTRPVTVTVLIPAHDEEEILPVTLPALLTQSRPPDRVIVVADNCTDGTVAVAVRNGVEWFETIGNSEKKAGALNQVLADLLPSLGDNDVVMVMDADTSLDQGFIAEAVRGFTADRALMAVGGIFYGEDGHAMLGQFQRNEYIRYSRQINRRRGRVFVLTGTSSIFRPAGMRAVADARGVTIPGRPGDVYDTHALTEDNELTIALKSLGALMVSPPPCTVVTELMPTWLTLWRQRMRWQRGAVENIGAYGLTPATARYWGQQVGIGYGTIAIYAFMFLMLITVLAVDQWVWFPFWLGIGSIFVLERVVTAWAGGWRARLLAASLFPELVYDLFLSTVFVKGLLDITFGRVARWGHVARDPDGAIAVVE
jgi:cellulose synthase/poly-beta-1,6-N-acetylglucosamine synthase-like glycosyltransferase